MKCYWCEYWVYDPYIIDWIGQPLCNMCFDWLVDEGGGPYEPTRRTRCSRWLLVQIPRFRSADITAKVASFLVGALEP